MLALFSFIIESNGVLTNYPLYCLMNSKKYINKLNKTSNNLVNHRNKFYAISDT